MAAQQERKLPLGKIEPNTAKYFSSCALGGIVGESCLSLPYRTKSKLTIGKPVVGALNIEVRHVSEPDMT